MKIAFRTEGNHRQGLGDVWGSLALADEFARRKGASLFLVSAEEEGSALIRTRGYEVRTASTLEEELAVLASFAPDVLIANRLTNPPGYFRSVRTSAPLLVSIDDATPAAEEADLRINPLYPVPGSISGPEYLMLRTEIRTWRERDRQIPDRIRGILVTQGGSDTYGFTPRIVDALRRWPESPPVTVVLGPAFRHPDELSAARKDHPVVFDVVKNAPDMGGLLWEADLVVTAGGLTLFESACVGTPSLAVCGERFEVETAARMEKAGATINFGFGAEADYPRLVRTLRELSPDPARRRAMSERGRACVDGRGAARIVSLVSSRLREKTGATS